MGERTRVAQHLQESPASVNAYEADGYTALHLAAYFRHVDIARMLLMARADANIEARNVMRARPMHSALYQTDHYVAEPLVRMLLEAGADPKAPARRRSSADPRRGAQRARCGGQAPGRGRRRSECQNRRWQDTHHAAGRADDAADARRVRDQSTGKAPQTPRGRRGEGSEPAAGAAV